MKGVAPDAVTVVNKEGNEYEIPFGACVWATGVAMHPVVKLLADKLPAGTQVRPAEQRRHVARASAG